MAKLLIVEDEKNLRILYKNEFIEEGYEVLLAAEGKEAIKIAEKESPDLIIMDIRMPQMDGIDVMKKILEKNKDIPIVINSAYSSYMDNFMSWAAKAYVIKSSDLSELKSKVREYIGE
ncbi:MAG: response regulator [Candidatus Helarchaeota archaeon]|nr:response regulator [Candidatus Helarchaeota archaeon]